MECVMRFRSVVLGLSLILVPYNLVMAQRPVQTSSPRPAPPRAGYVAPVAVVQPSPSPSAGVLNNGLDASQKQGDGGAAAAAAAAIMAATMAATCPNPETMPICIAAGIGLAASMLTGSEMDKAQNLSNSQVSAVRPTTNPTSTPAPTFASSPQYAAAMRDLEKATSVSGVKISKDRKTITTPDGRTISTASALSGGGGLTSSESKALKDMMKKAQEAAAQAVAAKAKKDSETATDAVGGGSTQATTSGALTGGSAAGSRASVQNRNQPGLQGAFKDLNGDRIGVAFDSMFVMIHRRYVSSAERDYFDLTGGAGSSEIQETRTRAPAAEPHR